MKPETGDGALDAVLAAAHRARTATDARLRSEGLSLSRYKLLQSLERGSRSMREVSEALAIAPRTVTDLIDGLEARGLVVRSSHPTDRRITLLHLTDKGQTKVAEAKRSARAVTAAAVRDLSTDERQTLVSLVERIQPAEPPADDAG